MKNPSVFTRRRVKETPVEETCKDNALEHFNKAIEKGDKDKLQEVIENFSDFFSDDELEEGRKNTSSYSGKNAVDVSWDMKCIIDRELNARESLAQKRADFQLAADAMRARLQEIEDNKPEFLETIIEKYAPKSVADWLLAKDFDPEHER